MKIHYLEIVTLDVDGVCTSYETIYGIKFSSADPHLGNAKTMLLSDGSSIGVRAPLRDTEEAVIRPYWLVNDINIALNAATKQGAQVAHSPLEIPGKGTFAIYFLGGTQLGLWQL